MTWSTFLEHSWSADCSRFPRVASLNPFPTLIRYTGLGSALVCVQLAPLRPPGTDLKVDMESRRHEGVFTGRWWHELRVIHTN